MPAMESKSAKVQRLNEDSDAINRLAAQNAPTGPTVVTATDPTQAPKVEQVAPLMSHWADDQAAKAAAPAGKAAAADPSSAVQVIAHSGTKANEDNPALGYMGPLGPYGPLGSLGPVGQNSWNPSTVISGSFDWSAMQKQLTAHGGPLSEAGPLGPSGPVAMDQKKVLPELQAGGDAAVLGPLGPLGALGPLGPLGPVGAHGYKADADGNYRDPHGNIVRSVDVPYQGGKRSYDLVENYTKDQAEKMQDNDTSFMVHGALDKSGEVDSFSFQAKNPQYVTVLLVPEQQLDAFELTVRDENGKELYDSKSITSIAWAQLRVPAGTRLQAQVKLKASFQFVDPPPYRLIVTGADQQ
jgi:hypothetical protein